MTEPASPPEEPLRIENTYHWPADGESRSWTEFWITTFTGPVGKAEGAFVRVCREDGGEWERHAMEHACVLGEQDVWHVNLGVFPAGTRLRYAIEAVHGRGVLVWDNNGGRDHRAVIGTSADFARGLRRA